MAVITVSSDADPVPSVCSLRSWPRPDHRGHAGETFGISSTPEVSRPVSVPFWVWALTIVGIIGMLVFDFFAHVRTPHAPSLKESAWWSIAYIAIALLFGVGLWMVWGSTHGTEYFAGYLTEKSLSVDNLFVFLIIMTRFKVPREDQQKVLLVGIAIALVCRGAFIAVGAAAISHFSWVFYIFGALLFVIAWHQIKPSDGEGHPEESRLVRFVGRVLPTTPDYVGDKISVIRDGRRVFTPMLIVMVAIGSTDVLFALDSIPAIFGLTKEPYIVFTANAFALLGLRQLYFLISDLLQRLVYLAQGLAAILAFIGVKLVLEALHTNELPFINGGENVSWAPEIPISVSLGVIVGVMAIATIASLWKTRLDGKPIRVEADADQTPPDDEPKQHTS